VRLQICLAAMALATPQLAALAEITPVPGKGDPRIQTVAYDPEEVVALRVSSGYAVTVRLSPEERIETVTLGDPGSWQVSVNKRADSLILKPIGPAQPSNLTVISDQRSYAFAVYGAAEGASLQPYLVTFTYPDAAATRTVEPANVSRQYQMRGERSLWPLSISDDGSFTSLRWGDSSNLPAVYSQDKRGNLALVNGTVRDGAYVIEGVPSQLVFILGGAKATATRLEAEKSR